MILNRPEVRNALHPDLIAEVEHCLRSLADDVRTRCIVLTGAGAAFSAGADIGWLQRAVDLTQAENVADALALCRMLEAVDRCPKPVIARVNGSAFAGGAGLVAACDLAVAVASAQFAFTEVALGIVPATVSPYVLRKIGPSWTRYLFLTGERFDARRACALGLVHAVTEEAELDAAVTRLTAAVLRGGPRALAAAKELVAQVAAGDHRDDLDRFTAELLATLRTSPEGQEGLRAFLERRPPSWAEAVSERT
ncbi:MAG: enoyl-CoA hydratase/isomerase family protein [Chloroflexi bacterium]|nr:enoyl-CoA hydratase/isomerase family protein [Chloroflexota bacterium]